MDFITNSLSKGNAVDVVFMDFAKAFDAVHKLSAYGIIGHTLKWLESFLKNCRQKVVLAEFSSEWKEVRSGIPQGYVLGPILFIIYINDMPELLKSVNKLYAYDTKLLAEIKNIDNINVLQNDTNKIAKWSQTWLLYSNESKCKVMHLGKSNKHHNYTISSIANEIISICSTNDVKDLGVTLSSKTKYHSQVMYASNKANKIHGMISRTFTYMDSKLLKTLFTALVRPHLEFAI